MATNPEFEDSHLRRQRRREIKRNRNGRPVWKGLVVWGGRALLTLVVVGFFLSLSMFISRSEMFSLREVQVLGNRHLDSDLIRRAIRQEFPNNLFLVRLRKVRELVEAQPWVQSCQVRRVFPHTLKILVVERRPVVLAKIENELFLADRDGVILEAYGPRFRHLDLAVVRGLESSTLESVSADNRARMEVVMRVLRELDSGAERLSDRISEIDITDPGRVALVPLDQPVKVYLGDSNYRVRYQTFLSRLSMMRELAAKYGAMDSVDLSVEHRIIFHTKMGRESNITVKNEQEGRGRG